MGWIQMEHPETGGTTLVPDEPGVVEAHEARGWRVVPDDAPPAPEPARKATKKTAEPGAESKE